MGRIVPMRESEEVPELRALQSSTAHWRGGDALFPRKLNLSDAKTDVKGLGAKTSLPQTDQGVGEALLETNSPLEKVRRQKGQKLQKNRNRKAGDRNSVVVRP